MAQTSTNGISPDWGSQEPDDRIGWARAFYGTNYLLLEVAQGGMQPQHVVSSPERFAQYVIPTFREGQ